MTTWTVFGIQGTHPAGYLAAIGLTALIPGARAWFDDTTLTLAAPTSTDEAVVTVAESLERATHPDRFPLPADLTTTTPRWSVAGRFCHASWSDAAIDAVLRTMDTGSVTDDSTKDADPKARSAALVLISGKSYVRKSLASLWEVKPRQDPAAQLDAHRDRLRDELQQLLEGRPVPLSRGDSALRYTAPDPVPRLRHGVDTATYRSPCLEMLAYIGATHLLPRQYAVPLTAAGRPGPGLTWALNPVPLTLTAMLTIHEQSAAPQTWAAYTASIRTGDGADTSSQFVDTRPLEAP